MERSDFPLESQKYLSGNYVPILALQELKRDPSVLCQLNIHGHIAPSDWALVLFREDNFGHWLYEGLGTPASSFPLCPAPRWKRLKFPIAKQDKRRLPERIKRLLKINSQNKRNLWRQSRTKRKWADFGLRTRFYLQFPFSFMILGPLYRMWLCFSSSSGIWLLG